jgi:hypothetical protein
MNVSNASLTDLLSHLGCNQSDIIGAGAEAQVFALSKNKVVRVQYAGSDAGDGAARVALLSRLAHSAPRFDIPRVIDHGQAFGLHFCIEDRLSGAPMHVALAQCHGAARSNLVQDYLETSMQIAPLLTGGAIFGELGLNTPIQSLDFKTFLADRAQASLRVRELRIKMSDVIDAIAAPAQPELVHLDYCPSNVLCENGRITAVLDFGGTTIAGCGKFNPVIATAFLNPVITPSAHHGDHIQAQDWLATVGDLRTQSAIAKWLAAYWSFCGADEDLALYRWCCATLGVD